MSRRIGLLGGTFDPIHVGHLDAAEAAFEALGLDYVALVPSLQPPHRGDSPRASSFHRFAMTALAAASRPYYRASDLELRTAGGPTYTVDTLARLHAAGMPPLELFFITGADAFADIATWKRYPDVLEHAHFAIVSRPGHPVAALRERLPALNPRMHAAAPGFTASSLPAILLVDRRTHDVSSTSIRRACRDGQSITGMVPAAVEAHILRHQLYGSDSHQPFVI